LDAEIEARRRADHLLAGALERLAALPATISEPSSIRDARVDANTGPGATEPAKTAADAGMDESSFWSRVWRAVIGR
jgi:hypothetical protein